MHTEAGMPGLKAAPGLCRKGAAALCTPKTVTLGVHKDAGEASCRLWCCICPASLGHSLGSYLEHTPGARG